MSDLGPLSCYLGIEVKQMKDCIMLSQAGYAKKLLDKTGMTDCNPTKILMGPKLQISKNGEGEPVNPTEYKSSVGSLRYLLHTRLDISHYVGIVSRYMEQPTTQHYKTVKQILRYIKGTLNFGLVYTKKDTMETLVGFTDSNLQGDIDDRKSTSGMAFYFNNNLVS